MSPIAKLLSHYGATKVPSGRGWRSRKCPFHSDRHASATVNNDTQGTWYIKTFDGEGSGVDNVIIATANAETSASERFIIFLSSGDKLRNSKRLRSRSKLTEETVKSIVFIAGKHDLNPNLLIDSLVEAWRKNESDYKSFKIYCSLSPFSVLSAPSFFP